MIKLKKFTTYEFDVEVPGDGVDSKFSVEYKLDNNNRENSFMRIVNNNTQEETKLLVSVLAQLHQAMVEVDPIGFAFDEED